MNFKNLVDKVSEQSTKESNTLLDEEVFRASNSVLKFAFDGVPFYLAGSFVTYCKFKNIKDISEITLMDEVTLLKTLTLEEYKEKYPEKTLYYEFFKWFTS
jgi:hypothetical protein